MQKMIIEDVTDCKTCTEREFGELEFLAEVKCSVLTDVICSECGRSFTLLIEEQK